MAALQQEYCMGYLETLQEGNQMMVGRDGGRERKREKVGNYYKKSKKQRFNYIFKSILGALLVPVIFPPSIKESFNYRRYSSQAGNG